MNKAKTAKVLSAAAVANMAVAGFAASPAIASTHAVGTVAGRAAAASGAGSPNGVIFTPGGRGVAPRTLSLALKAGATPAKPRGFVPRVAKSVKPDTETNCNSYICVGLYGGGNYVSYFNAHWFAGSPSSPCRDGNLWYLEPNGEYSSYPSTGVCYKKQITEYFYRDFPTGTEFCASFSNLPGTECEPVR